MTTQSQSEYWNSDAGARWVRQQPIMDALLRAHGERALAAAGFGEGAAVLDVGCGCGATSLAAATRVGPDGLVVGVDISAPMLALARERAATEHLTNVRFELGDVQTHALDEGRYDAVVSRFGVMFFTDPPAAFARLRTALRAGGRFSAVCWRAPSENPWISLPIEVTSGFLTTEPVDPDAPGPFSLARRERTAALLARAGFGGVNVEALDFPLTLGQTAEEAARLMVVLGPIGRVMLSAAEELRQKAIDAIAAALGPYQTEAGVRLPSGAWLVTAGAD
ncbi:MAG TPA: class I SAM-dependent methyltransferase [Polyangiaceae bacterium]|jgi:SAM-dependent methyltransferase|nr:class I SAM-dependent methyltransferase [Polyangiaceae bacterium]